MDLPGGPYLVAGLGNPGDSYHGTRHNAGRDAVERLRIDGGFPSWTRAVRCEVSAGRMEGRACVLARPLSYMNLSGPPVASLLSERTAAPDRLLVVVDDFALPLGRLRLRPRGSDGGHNGLASLEAALGTAEYARLRIGIGPVPPGAVAEEFVLERFGKDERPVLEEALARAAACVRAWLAEGIAAAMERFNAALE